MAKEITQEALDVALLESNVELRESYSGRGMYGDTCWGVVGEVEELNNFERQLAKSATVDMWGPVEGDVEGVIEDFLGQLDEIESRRRIDSMGMNTIYYYPGIKIA